MPGDPLLARPEPVIGPGRPDPLGRVGPPHKGEEERLGQQMCESLPAGEGGLGRRPSRVGEAWDRRGDIEAPRHASRKPRIILDNR